MINVLIADDHKLFRECLRRILEDDHQLRVVGESDSGPDTLRRAKELHPQIVLLDLEMPGGGFSVAKDLKSWDPGLRILVLTAHEDDEFALRSLKLGLEGFLTKSMAVEELLNAVHRVHAIGRYISSGFAERLAFRPKSRNREAHESLSEREHQVFQLIASGKSTSEIANELNLSVKTISTYRLRIREKTDLKGTAEIVRYAMGHQLQFD